jgi:hypothetical protein
MSKYITLVILLLFSTLGFSYEITMDDEGRIKVFQRYSDNSSFGLSLKCDAKQKKGLYFDSHTGFYLLYADVEIELSKRVDMRPDPDSQYDIILGSYSVCEATFNKPYCRTSLMGKKDINYNNVAFIEDFPSAEVMEYKDAKSDFIGGHLRYSCNNITGFTDNHDDETLCEKKITTFNVSWFPKAFEEMNSLCNQHQDKVNSHIKRLLDW